MEMVKSFPQTFVGVNVIVTTKPFKAAPFLTDWVNYKQIQPAMGLLPTMFIRNICYEFYFEDHNNIIGMRPKIHHYGIRIHSKGNLVMAKNQGKKFTQS